VVRLTTHGIQEREREVALGISGRYFFGGWAFALSIHALTRGRLHLFSLLNFMIDLSGHATTDTAKDDIGNEIDNSGTGIIAFTGSQTSHDGKEAAENL